MSDAKVRGTQKSILFFAVWCLIELAIIILCAAVSHSIFNVYFAAGSLFWGVIVLLAFFMRGGSFINSLLLKNIGKKEMLIIIAVVAATILICILPMSMSPHWNGEIPWHRNQYEVMAQSIKNGHIYLDYNDIDPGLEMMENPYDPEAREAAGVGVHWDHAYYNGRYYMYFGIVPVFILFLPYLLITGHSLTTYHATQIFVAFAIVGIFMLFWQLARRYFNTISLGMYLVLSAALSVMSIWYSIDAPALYCTAITSGICMEVWSLFFFTKAVYLEQSKKRRLIFALLGACFGALAFGCRPPVALGNILIIPMFIDYIRFKKADKKTILSVIAVLIPYIAVGILLMAYNYVRFDSPFEFGQSYQMTEFDQHNYGSFSERFDITRECKGLVENFFAFAGFKTTFPYIGFNGAFINFPILFSIFAMFFKLVRRKLKQSGLYHFAIILFIAPIIVTLADVHWVQVLSERYRMDIYYLLALLCFIVICAWYTSISKKEKTFRGVVCLLGLFTIFTCFILFLVPHDVNITEVSPEVYEKFRKTLTFGGLW